MLGLMLLCLISAAKSQEEDTALRHQRNQLSSQLLSLEESVQHKEFFILKQDEVISDLQRQLQRVKDAELETLLKKNKQELLNLRGKIQSLELDIEGQVLESQQKSMPLVKGSNLMRFKWQFVLLRVLSLLKELILQAQARVDKKDQDISKVYTQWLPEWAMKDLAYWQGTWITTLNEAWKWAVLLAVCAYERLHESKFLKHLDAYMQRAQKVLVEEVHAAWKFCMSFLGEPVETLGLRLNQSSSFLQPCLSKLKQSSNKALKYGIKHHLKLQRSIRKIMQRNKYLASKESREVVWFLASAMLILPLYGALLLSSFLSNKRRLQVARAIFSHRRRQAVHLRRAQR